MNVEYTHPDVFTRGVQEGWAEAEADPTRIDWPSRQARAAIPFAVVDGRPVNPCEETGVRYGRNNLGHWGEQLCADAIVTATDTQGNRWLLLIERGDGHGWALPGGYVDKGEPPLAAAARELTEESSLEPATTANWVTLPACYVPDPRASDESWMVTVPSHLDLGTINSFGQLPDVAGRDDARNARWVRANSFDDLVEQLHRRHNGELFKAHQTLLAKFIGSARTR